MDINGLVEFLQFLKDGGELSDFELLRVEEYDKANMKYGATLGYGSLQYVVNSWMPPKMLRSHLLTLAHEVAAKE